MYKLCIRDGTFDFGALADLKSSVSLREAKEIEAVLCVEGDNRHTFQTWYGDWMAKRKGKPDPERIDSEFFAKAAGKHAIDVDVVMRERMANEDMLAATETHLQAHRQAVVLGQESPLPLGMVDALETQLAMLKVSKETIETQLIEALGELPPRADLTPTVAGHASTVVGPVQSGSLRKG